MRGIHKTSRYSAAGLLLAAAFGCQSEPDSLAEVNVEIPEQFESNGSTWKHQVEPSPTDTECLHAFFAHNKDFAGSPDFEGKPTMFLAGENDRRYYWLHPSVEGVRWQVVEFSNRRFSIADGSGDPFN